MGNGISIGLLGLFYSINYFYFTYKENLICSSNDNKKKILNEETKNEIEM